MAGSRTLNRANFLDRLATTPAWDVVVIGGGATGLGIAVDAAARGFSVALVEAHDFAKGTSSRTTKLVHGGVRYLAQGNFSLVKEALHERARLLANAPHLAQPLPIVMPAYRWWERAWYGTGLRLYDLLAGDASLGKTETLGAYETERRLPSIEKSGLRGGVQY
jgi:glycerol-3-phosphate dehydrogenase